MRATFAQLLSLAAYFFGVAAFGTASLEASELPQRLAAGDPFPRIIAQAPTISFVAPGVTEAEYDLLTVDGPVIVHAIAVDLHRSDIHLSAVLGNDQLLSPGETVRSMALRTGAVAGINGDYFDINSTNQPLNILVRNGTLLHPPIQRYALAIDSNGAVQFEEFQTAPSDVVTAIGGGPLLLHNGQWFADPDGPNGKEFAQRIPASGVATTPDGTLFLVQIDGNRPDRSIGVTRPEFAEILRALGATEGMAFDGGGSSTLVARRLGEKTVSLQNLPSDGFERRVADGLFVYSDAPIGEPAQIAVQPAAIHALVGATVDLRAAVTDDAGHVLRTLDAIHGQVTPSFVAAISNTVLFAKHAGIAIAHLQEGSFGFDLPVSVTERPARVVIAARGAAVSTLNLDVGQRIVLQAQAYDKNGYPLALPSTLQWSAAQGTIFPDGTYTAGSGSAAVSVRIGGVSTSALVTVGHHEVPFSIGTHLTFSTVPHDGPGQIINANPCPTCVQLAYDFSGNERAAYVHSDTTLPRGTLGIAFDVQGDPTNALLRVKITNAINEQKLLTAGRLTFTGTRHIVVLFPPGLVQPIKFASIYVLSGMSGSHVSASGSVTLSNLHIVVPGP